MSGSTTKQEAGISDAAVSAATGKSWREWFGILDRAGARRMTHRDIAAYLHEKQSVPPWWSQSVTVAYEQARGLREKHQGPGGYTVGRSKTLPVAVGDLFDAWNDPRKRSRWLGEKGLVVRTATRPKSMRVTWPDGKTGLEVYFNAIGEGRSQVVVQHTKLPSAREAERRKAYWGERLERLRAFLGVGRGATASKRAAPRVGKTSAGVSRAVARGGKASRRKTGPEGAARKVASGMTAGRGSGKTRAASREASSSGTRPGPAAWLLKTEPGSYAFDDLVRERTAVWDGVTNPVALRNLRQMQVGERVVIYHTGSEKSAVGYARITRTAYPDPKGSDERLAVVDLEVGERLPRPVALAELKAHPAFAESPLVRQGRLSVVPLTRDQLAALESLARKRG